MFGFLFGLACLGGLYWYLTREEELPVRRRARRRWFRRHLLRRLYHKLDATPSQEAVIETAFRDLEGEGQAMRRAVAATREDVSRIMRSDHFDRDALSQALGRHDAALNNLREQVIETLGKVHGSLDSFQRARLADMILEGHGGCGFRHGLRRFA